MTTTRYLKAFFSGGIIASLGFAALNGSTNFLKCSLSYVIDLYRADGCNEIVLTQQVLEGAFLIGAISLVALRYYQDQIIKENAEKESQKSMVKGPTFTERLNKIGFPLEKVPEEFLDIYFSKEPMNNPYFCVEDGWTYEGENAERWFKTSLKSPHTALHLRSVTLFSNVHLRSAFEEFISKQESRAKDAAKFR